MLSREKVVGFSAGIEAATGVGLIAVPAVVIRLLLATDLTESGVIVARFFGVALVALGLAVWPRRMETTAQAARAMLVYNAALAVYLVWLGTAGHFSGLLLWPAAAVHVIVSLLLARPSATAA